MKVLLTGASGFLGSAIARSLIAAGYGVRVLVRAESNPANLDGLDVERAVGDLRDPESFRPALDGCGGLFHCAADYRMWTPRPAELFAANVDGTRHLLTAAITAGVARIVYTSSVATLGLVGNGGVADETTPSREADMIGAYKRSKYLAEREVQRLIKEHAAPVVIVNPSTPIGPRDIKPTPTGTIVVQAARGRMPAYVDTGLNVAHVDDVADGHVLAFEKGQIGERYILGGENMTLRQILAAVAAIMGRQGPCFRVPHAVVLPIAYIAEGWARLRDITPFTTVTGAKLARKKMYFSTEKAIRALGYRPRPAEAALADAITWFRAHGHLG